MFLYIQPYVASLRDLQTETSNRTEAFYTHFSSIIHYNVNTHAPLCICRSSYLWLFRWLLLFHFRKAWLSVELQPSLSSQLLQGVQSAPLSHAAPSHAQLAGPIVPGQHRVPLADTHGLAVVRPHHGSLVSIGQGVLIPVHWERDYL